MEYVAKLAEQNGAEVIALSEDRHTGEMLVGLKNYKGMYCLCMTTTVAEEFYSRRFYDDEEAMYDAFGSEHNGR
jgi:hypothetical protein